MTDQNKGFIRSVVAVVIALIVLAYFGYDVREYINFEKAGRFLLDIWNNYILVAYRYIVALFT